VTSIVTALLVSSVAMRSDTTIVLGVTQRQGSMRTARCPPEPG